MRTPVRTLWPSIAALFLFFGLGCASSSVTKIEDPQNLPSELGKDLEKFEVREAGDKPAPQPTAATVKTIAPSSLTKIPKPKKGKKAELKQAQAETAVFSWPQRRPSKDPIWIGEKMTYEISYFGMSAGDFTLTALPLKEINNRKVYHIHGTAVSSKVFSLFYKLNDTIESFVDYDGLFSHRFHIVLDESKQTRNSLELYDPEKGRTFYWSRWNHHKKGYQEVKDFFPMTPFAQDSLSALYYLRTVPLQDGAVFSFPVVSEGKNWEAQITVVRRETIDTVIGKVKAVVLKPETKYQGILKKQGDSFVWLSDDDRRILLKLEAKVKIGTVVARIKDFHPGDAP